MTEPAVGSRGYARRGALDVPPPPWRSEDVQLDAFYLHGDLAALQRLCDRSFNAPSGGQMQFRPVTRYVVLTFQRLHNLRSQAPGCETLGTLNYCEAAFWVFVQQYDREGDKVGGTVLAIPYIFAQNSLAVAAGREIYGFPKEYATVAMPEREAAADLYTVRAAALRTLSVGASVEPDCEILRCARVGDSALAALAHGAAEFGGDLVELLLSGRVGETPLALAGEVVDALLKKRIDMVFLRQIRASNGGCDLQQIVAASEAPLAVKHMQLLRGCYTLTLPQYESHPIAADLGLAAGADGSVDVVLGMRVDLAFTLTAARLLWPAES